MNRAELLAEATAAVCGPIIADFRRGLIDQEKLQQMIARRKDTIAAYMRDRQSAPKTVRCSECGCAATTRMNGADYCDAHAKNHRLALPAGMAA